VNDPEQNLPFRLRRQSVEVNHRVYRVVIHAQNNVALCRVIGCRVVRVDINNDKTTYVSKYLQLLAQGWRQVLTLMPRKGPAESALCRPGVYPRSLDRWFNASFNVRGSPYSGARENNEVNLST
jgi:hypothetical protein